MPRNGRGGAREGAVGGGYTNRTDMQAPKAKTGQTYGQAGQQIAAQKQVPLPDTASSPSPGGGTAPVPAAGGPSPLDVLSSMPGLTDPSLRPDEPLTAGMPTGEGPGPSVMPHGSVAAGLLRRMVAAGNTDPVLFELLAEAERAR